MKKLIITLGVLSLLATSARATIILSNSFAYPDGSLTNVSSGSPLGVWTNHSGSGVLDVSSGVVLLSQLNAPDVSSPLSGSPYSTNGYLYSSFKVNFSALPAGVGSYFWHLKNSGSDFRARIWASVTGAGPGTFRVGIAAGSGTAVFIPVDLSLGSEYKLVVRYNTTNAASTLWISPTSEAAVTSRADSTDIPVAPVAPPILSVSLRQSTSGGAGMGVMTFDDLLVGTAFTDVQTVGGPPSISGLINVSIPANSNTGPLPFLASDVETAAGSLTVAATSDNPTLVPNNPANLTFGGSGANRTLTVTPAASQEGTANIQVVVTDGNSETATNNFTITVGLPTITTVPNVIALTNTVSGPLVIAVNDNETAPGSLTVTGTSSDQTVLPDANIAIQVSGGSRTIFLTNAAPGVATVTLTVNDGVFNVSTNFVLTAYPDNGVLLADDFGYADGSIVLNTTPLWTTHSAGAADSNQTQVATGKLFLNNTASEDINRIFTNAPVLNTGGQLIFTRMIVNFSALPTAGGVGEYFTHVYGFSGAFRARVFASTNGAASGSYRLGISSSSFTPAMFPQNLSLNQSYVLISRYNTATAESVLWVNPASESSSMATATDTSATITAYGVAFRQSTGIGSMSIDDLVIGSTFAEVFTTVAPAPIPLNIQQVGSDAILTWSNPQFNLQASSLVTGTYTNVPGATSPFTNAASADQKYFRLVYP